MNDEATLIPKRRISLQTFQRINLTDCSSGRTKGWITTNIEERKWSFRDQEI